MQTCILDCKIGFTKIMKMKFLRLLKLYFTNKISQMTKSRRRRWRRKSKTNLDGDPRRRDPPLIHNHYDLKVRSVGYRFSSWWCEGGPLSYDRKKFWGVSGSLYQIFIVVRLNESIMKTLMGIFLISVILVQTKQGKSYV